MIRKVYLFLVIFIVINITVFAIDKVYKKMYCHDDTKYVKVRNDKCLVCNKSDLTKTNDGGLRFYCVKCDRYRVAYYNDTPTLRVTEFTGNDTGLIHCAIDDDTNLWKRAEWYFNSINGDTNE